MEKADNRGVAEGEDAYLNGTTGLPVGIHEIDGLNSHNVLRRNRSLSALVHNGGRKGWLYYAHRHMPLVVYLAHRVLDRRSCMLLLDRKIPLFVSNLYNLFR